VTILINDITARVQNVLFQHARAYALSCERRSVWRPGHWMRHRRIVQCTNRSAGVSQNIALVSKSNNTKRHAENINMLKKLVKQNC